MSTRLSTLIIILLLMHIVLSACAQDHDHVTTATADSPGLKPSPALPITAPVSKETVNAPDAAVKTDDWLPTSVTLTCSLKSCLPQVGVLIFAIPTAGQNFDVRRCTAFLIDHDKVMTNGHCDFLENNEGYFITRTDMPGKTFRKITKLLFKKFTPNVEKPEMSSMRPDVAVFQLESAIPNLEPLHVASGAAKNYSSLTALVVNPVPGQDTLALTIGQLNCTVRRHERFFPFNLSELPDIINAFDCESEKGNSGSPMFAPGSADVEAILFGGKDMNDFAKTLKEKDKRAPYPYETHQTTSATNLRCIGYPVGSKNTCIQATDDEMKSRFLANVNGIIKGFDTRKLENSTMGYRDFPNELKLAAGGPGGEWEIMYLPACRSTPTVATFGVPSEHVSLSLDIWATPTVKRLDLKTSTGTVNAQSANGVTVDNMSWIPDFGTFVHPEVDLRTQLGHSFSVALPPCTS